MPAVLSGETLAPSVRCLGVREREPCRSSFPHFSAAALGAPVVPKESCTCTDGVQTLVVQNRLLGCFSFSTAASRKLCKAIGKVVRFEEDCCDSGSSLNAVSKVLLQAARALRTHASFSQCNGAAQEDESSPPAPGQVCRRSLPAHALSATGRSAGALCREEDVSCPPTLGRVSAASSQGAQFRPSLHARGSESPSLFNAQEDESFPPVQGMSFPPAPGQVCRKPFPARTFQVPFAAQEDVFCPLGQSQVSANVRLACVLHHEEDVLCSSASGQVFAAGAQGVQVRSPLHASGSGLSSLTQAQEDVSFPSLQRQAFPFVSGQVCKRSLLERPFSCPSPAAGSWWKPAWRPPSLL